MTMAKKTGKRSYRNPGKSRGIKGNGSNQKGGGSTGKHSAKSAGSKKSY